MDTGGLGVFFCCYVISEGSTVCLKNIGISRLHFLSHFFFNFQNLSAHLLAIILNFPNFPLHALS